MEPGPRNLITDVPGLLVGNAEDPTIKTGTTVLTADRPFVATVDVMGGAPGTRETDCLDPDRLVSEVDALVLSGGSAFGLDAASGVMDALAAEGRGFSVGDATVPIVPAAILFDLLNGGDKSWDVNPYRALGVAALANRAADFALGTAGAGFGATTAGLKGGLGSASLVLDGGITVGALVAANPHGGAVVPGTGKFWAAPFEVGEEFGGLGPATEVTAFGQWATEDQEAPTDDARANTTIAIVATDATLDKSQLKRIAVAAQDGMARALVPAHTPVDGDLVFSLATGDRPLEDPVRDVMMIGHAASVCLSRAIARGVYLASAEPGDTVPTWADEWGPS